MPWKPVKVKMRYNIIESTSVKGHRINLSKDRQSQESGFHGSTGALSMIWFSPSQHSDKISCSRISLYTPKVLERTGARLCFHFLFS